MLSPRLLFVCSAPVVLFACGTIPPLESEDDTTSAGSTWTDGDMTSTTSLSTTGGSTTHDSGTSTGTSTTDTTSTGTETGTTTGSETGTTTDTGGTTGSDPCLPPLVLCGLDCIDPLTDQNHCGAKDDCLSDNSGTMCSLTQQCVDGTCKMNCPAGQIDCEGSCIDPLTNSNYCGASKDCKSPHSGELCGFQEQCINGKCDLVCTAPEVECNNACIDPQTDDKYCGAKDNCLGGNAGMPCAADQECKNGTCTIVCSTGLVLCDGNCIDPLTDPLYCGAKDDCGIGNSGDNCGSSRVCANGVCQVDCNNDQVECDGLCIDPKTSHNHCGASGDCMGPNSGLVCKADEECEDSKCVKSACGDFEFEVKPDPAEVMLLLDKSGSMYDNSWDDNGMNKRRWESLHSTVTFLVDEYNDRAHFGAKLFPKFDATFNNECQVDPGVDTGIAANNGAAVLMAIPTADARVRGSTPTEDGLRQAANYMKMSTTGLPQAIITVSDGLANCNNNNQEPLYDIARDSFANDIPVYAVGIDVQGDAVAILTRLAEAGGTEVFYNSDNADELRMAMSNIVDQITTCTIPFEPPPKFHDLVEIRINSSAKLPWLSNFKSCEDAAMAGQPDGWVYTKPGTWDEVEICGSYCTDFKDTGKVDVKFTCPPPV